MVPRGLQCDSKVFVRNRDSGILGTKILSTKMAVIPVSAKRTLLRIRILSFSFSSLQHLAEKSKKPSPRVFRISEIEGNDNEYPWESQLGKDAKPAAGGESLYMHT